MFWLRTDFQLGKVALKGLLFVVPLRAEHFLSDEILSDQSESIGLLSDRCGALFSFNESGAFAGSISRFQALAFSRASVSDIAG